MIIKTATNILLYEKEKYLGAIGGIALAIFLVILQWGFYLGFKRDITVIMDSIEADIWIIPKNRPSFDNWDSMEDLAYWKALSHPDVAKSSRMIWAYGLWRCPSTGGKESVQVLGFEYASGIAVDLGVGADTLSLLQGDGNVLICERDQKALGINHIEQDGAEIFGRKAIVIGYARNIHMFTTSYLVVTDLDNARAFVNYPNSYTSYIVCKCLPRANIKKVVKDLQEAIPEHTVLSTKEFRSLSEYYWENLTGIGPILLLTAFLGAIVGFLIIMITFYVSTMEKLPLFASMKAIGASTLEIILILLVQILICYVLGLLIATIGIYITLGALSKTSISIVITRTLVVVSLFAMAFCAILGCIHPIIKLIKTEPGEAFRT